MRSSAEFTAVSTNREMKSATTKAVAVAAAAVSSIIWTMLLPEEAMAGRDLSSNDPVETVECVVMICYIICASFCGCDLSYAQEECVSSECGT